MATVIVSRYLLNDSVSLAVSAGASLIVTGPSSQFCHGANVLRYLAEQGLRIRWHVQDDAANLPIAPAAVSYPDDADNAARVVGASFGPSRGGSSWPVVERDEPTVVVPATGWSGFLAMSGRRYDELTLSIMIPGLQACADWLRAGPVEVVRTSCGRILVGDRSLRGAELVGVAADPSAAAPYLNHMRDVYCRLDSAWREQRVRGDAGAGALQSAGIRLTEFFSVLLFLHTCYSEVIRRCLDRLSDSPMQRERLMTAATPMILRWQADESGLISAKKDLHEAGPELATPPISIEEDLRATTSRLRSMTNAGGIQFSDHLATVMVLKEWKFFLAKALHRHVGVIIRRTLGVAANSACLVWKIRAMPISELSGWVGERRVDN